MFPPSPPRTSSSQQLSGRASCASMSAAVLSRQSARARSQPELLFRSASRSNGTLIATPDPISRRASRITRREESPRGRRSRGDVRDRNSAALPELKPSTLPWSSKASKASRNRPGVDADHTCEAATSAFADTQAGAIALRRAKRKAISIRVKAYWAQEDRNGRRGRESRPGAPALRAAAVCQERLPTAGRYAVCGRGRSRSVRGGLIP